MRKIGILLFFAARFVLFSQTAQDQLLADADQAFRDKKYVESALLYQEAAERGAVNGELYYNQGNSWFMAGEIHKAHLSYLKAEYLKPGDGDIKRNLSFIRALGGEEKGSSSKGELLRVLFFWHYDLSLRLRALMLLVVNILFWLLLASLVIVKRRGRTFPLWPAVVAGLFLCALLISITVSRHNLNHHPAGVILAETVARKGDGESFEEAFNRPLEGGTEFRLEEDRSGWYRIELADGSEGWIEEGDAALVSFP